MALKRASDVETWRDTSVGLQVFLAQVILERINKRYQGDDPMGNVSRGRQIEMVLAEVHGLVRSPDPQVQRNARKALGLPEV